MSVSVTQTATQPKLAFEVDVREGRGASHHTVTCDPALYDTLAGTRGVAAPAFIEAVFAFLLEREPKESILGRFDLTVIGRYFPEWEDWLRRR
jgi:hypothetical protein